MLSKNQKKKKKYGRQKWGQIDSWEEIGRASCRERV